MKFSHNDMTVAFVLVILGVICIIVSAFPNPLSNPTAPRQPINLFNLGWGLVLAGVLIFG